MSTVPSYRPPQDLPNEQPFIYQGNSTSFVGLEGALTLQLSPGPIDTMSSAEASTTSLANLSEQMPLPIETKIEPGVLEQLWKGISDAFAAINTVIVMFVLWIASLFGFKREAIQEQPADLSNAIENPQQPSLGSAAEIPSNPVLSLVEAPRQNPELPASDVPRTANTISEVPLSIDSSLPISSSEENLRIFDQFCRTLSGSTSTSSEVVVIMPDAASISQPSVTLLQAPDFVESFEPELTLAIRRQSEEGPCEASSGLPLAAMQDGLQNALHEMLQQLVAAPARPARSGAITALSGNALQAVPVLATVGQADGMNAVVLSRPVEGMFYLNELDQSVKVIGEIALACLQNRDGILEVAYRARGIVRIQGQDVPLEFKGTLANSQAIGQRILNQLGEAQRAGLLEDGARLLGPADDLNQPADPALQEVFSQMLHGNSFQPCLNRDLFSEELGNRALVPYLPISSPSFSLAGVIPPSLFVGSHPNEAMPILSGVSLYINMGEVARMISQENHVQLENAVSVSVPQEELEVVRVDYETSEIDDEVAHRLQGPAIEMSSDSNPAVVSSSPANNASRPRSFDLPLIAEGALSNEVPLNQSMGLFVKAGAADAEDPMMRSFIQIPADPLFEKDPNYQGPSNLLASIWHALADDAHSTWNDDTPVAFVDGKIMAVEVNTQAWCQKNADTLFWLAAKTYGEPLAHLIRVRYGLENKQTLTWGNVKSVLIGIGANVNTQVLTDLFNQVKNGSKERLCEEYFSRDELEELRQVESFNQLTTIQMKLLLDAFRTVPVQGKRVPIIEALYNGNPPSGSVLYHDPVSHDTALLASFESITNLNIKDPDLALTEYISKEISYKVLQEGMVVPLLDKEGKLAYYKVGKNLPHKNDAVLPVILIPLTRGIIDAEHPLDLHIAFRGTQFTPSQLDSLASFRADFDPRGVGHSAFSSRKAELLELICDTLQEDEAQFANISVHGHSLGGALQMREVAHLVEHLVEQDKQVEIAAPILQNLAPEFNNKKAAFYEIVRQIGPGQEQPFRSVLEVFEEGKPFDQLKNLVNKAQEQGSLDRTVIAELKKVVDEGLEFKKALEQFIPDLDGRNVEALCAKSVNLEALFNGVSNQLEKIQLTAGTFHKVVAINAASANSPTVEIQVNDAFRDNLRVLEEKRPEFRIYLDYVRYDKDIIQDLGGGVLLGFGIVSPLLKKRVILHTPHVALDALGLHGARAYTANDARVRYTRTFIDENTPEDALEKILGGSFYWDPRTGSRVKWYASEVGAKLILVPHTALYATMAFWHTAIWLCGGNRNLTQERRVLEAAYASVRNRIAGRA